MQECSAITPYLAVIFTIVLALLAARHRRRRKTRKQCKLPPSPKLRIPFLGHLFPLFCGRDLVKKSKRLKSYYGDMFSYEVVGMNTVHLCSYELIREALKKPEVSSRIPFQKFSNINKVISDIYLHGFHGIVVTEGPEWREHRRFTMKTLKGFGFGKSSMEQMMNEEVNIFCEQLRGDAGSNVDLTNKFNVLVINSLWRIIGGKRFDYSDAKFTALISYVNKGFSAIAPTPRLALLFLFPFLRNWAPELTGFDAMKKGYHGMYEFLRVEIDKHREELDLDNPKDFIDAYLIEMAKKEEREDSDSFFYKDLGMECLFCVLCDLFLAGSETTATNLLWAVIFLMRHPEIQSKLAEELDEVVGRERQPELADQEEMPFTLAFINEVHRKASIVPLGVQHWTNSDVRVGGFTIPKDSIVVPNLWEVHHDPDTWTDPDVFRPERFLNSRGEFVKSERVIPFSIGARRCPGETLAKAEIFLFLTNLVQNFNFSTPEDEPTPSLDYQYGFTLLPQPFTVTIRPKPET